MTRLAISQEIHHSRREQEEYERRQADFDRFMWEQMEELERIVHGDRCCR